MLEWRLFAKLLIFRYINIIKKRHFKDHDGFDKDSRYVGMDQKRTDFIVLQNMKTYILSILHRADSILYSIWECLFINMLECRSLIGRTGMFKDIFILLSVHNISSYNCDTLISIREGLSWPENYFW